MIYLSSYQPLCSTSYGEQAITKYNLPPYVDGSCRREPDFEHEYPSITALYRGKLFAPKLLEKNKIVYITHKGFYGKSYRHWKLVAVVEVIKRTTHHDAYNWYKSKGMRIPINCIVNGKPPLPIEKTSGSKFTIHQWDYAYKVRAGKYDVFLICEHIITPNLYDPPSLKEIDFDALLQKQPQTRIPTTITEEQLKEILRLAANNTAHQ